MKHAISCLAAIAALLTAGAAFAQSAEEIAANAPASAWRTPDLQNTLYIDIPDGRFVIEMRPDLAPAHVARIKALAREGFYDGIVFHRVIEGFMAQGGDPTGTGASGSDKPDLPGEFTLMSSAEFPITVLGRDARAQQVGFSRGLPVGSMHEMTRAVRADGKLEAWGLHCPGVMSMARTNDPNSANSQFFLMFGDSRGALDRQYSVWGKIIHGFELNRLIQRGEPPDLPTAMTRVRVAADVPQSDRLNVEVMRTDSPEFRAYVEASGRLDDGFVTDMCDITVPSRLAQ
ncbi:MAG: peptidylprolyl isomerase [Pseudomonadota bacterium]